MQVKLKVAKQVWGECAARCCICQEKLIYREEGAPSSLVGDIAHIVAETSRGPRGNTALDDEERNDVSNLLLLCKKHHKLIDDHPKTYSVGR